MNLLEYYASLRRDILKIIGGVENSRQSLYAWDDTTPNYVTRRNLDEIYRKHVKLAARFGLYVIVRHADCGHPLHERRGKDGYVMDSIDGVNVKYRDTRFRWEGGQMYQGSRLCICPCSGNREATTHHVIEDIVHDVMGNQKTCRALESILTDVYSAIEAAGDGKARSGIREYLLRAVMNINEALMPIGMDDYIEQQMKMAGITPSPP